MSLPSSNGARHDACSETCCYLSEKDQLPLVSTDISFKLQAAGLNTNMFKNSHRAEASLHFCQGFNLKGFAIQVRKALYLGAMSLDCVYPVFYWTNVDSASISLPTSSNQEQGPLKLGQSFNNAFCDINSVAFGSRAASIVVQQSSIYMMLSL